MPGTEISTSHGLTHWCIPTLLCYRYYYCVWFINEQTDMLKNSITCHKLPSYEAVKLWFKWRQLARGCASQLHSLCICMWVYLLQVCYLLYFFVGELLSFRWLLYTQERYETRGGFNNDYRKCNCTCNVAKWYASSHHETMFGFQVAIVCFFFKLKIKMLLFSWM